MKFRAASVIALSTLAITAVSAKADIGAYNFEDFLQNCSQVEGTLATWNNRSIATCVYPGAGNPNQQQDWFWASQENVYNSLDTYKWGGSFTNPREAHRDLMIELELRRRDMDRAR